MKSDPDESPDISFCGGCEAQGSCCLEHLPDGSLQRLRGSMTIRRYGSGVTIFHQGDKAAGVAVVRSGWVRMVHVTSEGKVVNVGLVGPGGLLGLNELMAQGRHHVSAEVMAEAELEYFPGDRFKAIVQGDGAVALALLAALSRETHRSVGEICDIAGKRPPEERLLEKLNELAEKCGRTTASGVQLKLPFTVQQLAESIGCSRQWTTKVLKDLDSKGLIERRGAWITLIRN